MSALREQNRAERSSKRSQLSSNVAEDQRGESDRNWLQEADRLLITGRHEEIKQARKAHPAIEVELKRLVSTAKDS